MKVAGLFAGIGGIEFGLNKLGFRTELFCEILAEAQHILHSNYPDIPIHSDIKTLKSLPKVDVVTAGFPCQDLSIAGRKNGLSGANSSLIGDVFRLLKKAGKNSPEFLLIENVPYLLSLNHGESIRYITQAAYDLGYNWAYRIIDPRGFGIPQRRPRFIFLASKSIHPKYLLFSDDEVVDYSISDKLDINDNCNYGFYWTEGRIGIGWARNSIPPIKGGSGLGIPSAPAIWLRNRNFFGTPCMEDAERLQGFPEKWTEADSHHQFRNSFRWKLIGNSVNTRVSEWIGEKIMNQKVSGPEKSNIFPRTERKWPSAAFNEADKVQVVKASFLPERKELTPIEKFVQYPLVPLSFKAATGFHRRVKQSTLIRYPEEFVQSIELYIEQCQLNLNN